MTMRVINVAQQLATSFAVNRTAQQSASGTTTSGISAVVFLNSAGTGVSEYPLTVSGLTFTPSCIIAVDAANNDIAFVDMFDVLEATGNANTHAYRSSTNGAQAGAFQINGTSGAGAVSSTGFTIPVGFTAAYKWHAYS